MKPFAAGHDFIVMPFSAYYWLLNNLPSEDWQTFCHIYAQMHINRARRISVPKGVSINLLTEVGVLNLLETNKIELNQNWSVPEVLEMRNQGDIIEISQDQRNKIKWYLVKVFCDGSGIKKPEPSSAGEWRAFNKLWGTPLMEMFDQAPGNDAREKGIATEDAIKDALEYFKTQGLTYKAPSSIKSVVYNRFAKENNHGYY